MMIRGLYMHQI